VRYICDSIIYSDKIDNTFNFYTINNTTNTNIPSIDPIGWKKYVDFSWLPGPIPSIFPLYVDNAIGGGNNLTGLSISNYHPDYFNNLSVGFSISGDSSLFDPYNRVYLSRIYLRYDTSSIPDSAIINSVSLYTYNDRTIEGTGKINIIYDPLTGSTYRNLNTEWLRSPSLNSGSDFSSKALSASTLLGIDNKISGITISDNINLDINIYLRDSVAASQKSAHERGKKWRGVECSDGGCS
jgi:hypothetical protein